MSIDNICFDDFKQDVLNIFKCLVNIDKNKLVNIKEIVGFVNELITLVYDKHLKKYIYPEIIEQIISEHSSYNHNYFFNMSTQQLQKNKNRAKELLEKPQPEQRSKEWYDKRYNTIGASETAAIFNKSPFITFNKYMEKKIKPPETNSVMAFNIFCHHGVKYEPIAQQLYCKKNNTEIIEYGSINHESIPYIAASPDGITKDGTMLEIKCPFKRKITGIPPIYYWIQMQQQLEVCNLNKCDFLECKITEYDSWDLFTNDEDYIEKSCIIEYTNNNKLDYKYPDIFLKNKEEIMEWLQKQKKIIEKDSLNNYIRIIFWKLEFYSCMPVYRNKKWWDDNFPKIDCFWKEVGEKRKSYIPSKVIEKKERKKEVVYQFINDD